MRKLLITALLILSAFSINAQAAETTEPSIDFSEECRRLEASIRIPDQYDLLEVIYVFSSNKDGDFIVRWETPGTHISLFNQLNPREKNPVLIIVKERSQTGEVLLAKQGFLVRNDQKWEAAEKELTPSDPIVEEIVRRAYA